MKSATAVSYEIDDISTASEELAAQIREKLMFENESVGILYCQPEMEIAELCMKLKEKLGFDILGGTTSAGATLTNEGHHELAVTLHVLTASDCRFATAVSRPLSQNPREGIDRVYADALSGLDGEPKMIFFIAPMLSGISTDSCLTVLSEASGNLPVFGFVAADDYDFTNQKVFLNEHCDGESIALLLISGNVRPIFLINNLESSETISKKRVTKSEGNIIYEIDGKPAYEYIKEFPFVEDESTLLWNYQFFVELAGNSERGYASVSRALSGYDRETGRVTCFADVPQGSYIGLMYCDGSNVRESCREALAELNEKLGDGKAEADYQYSSVFFMSCSLRNMFLADEKKAEGELIKAMLPDRLTASGVYAYGEIAPTLFRDGKVKNSFHNATMTICAI